MPDTETELEVICLCAAWCGTCRELQAALEGFCFAGCALHWVDIDAWGEVLDAVDLETIPMLIVADRQGCVRFAGPIEPRLDQMERLLTALRDAPPSAAEDWPAIVAGLKAAGALSGG